MFRNYVLTAYKVFMRRKLFTAINLLCIVLTLVVLTVVTALLENAFFPTGVEGKSERFLQVFMMSASGGGPHNHHRRTGPLGYKIIDKYLKPLQSVEAVSAVTMPSAVSVYQGEQSSELMMRRTDAQYWKILDFKVLAGRVFNADDVDQGRFVAVINQSTARKLFGDAPAVGQKIDVAGQQFAVIGVVEDAMQLNAFSDIWTPVTTFPSTSYRSEFSGDFIALLLAKSAADLPQVRHEVAAIAKTVVFDDPQKFDKAVFWADSKPDVFARLLFGGPDAEDPGTAVVMAAIVGGMLLFMMLPALNLINLNNGRILERSAEIGVRKAFGATSRQLVWQLVVENVLLALAGGVIGLACAAGVLAWLEASGLIPYLKVGINFAVFAYSLLLAFVFGVMSGIIPAWKMSRLDPVHALKGAF